MSSCIASRIGKLGVEDHNSNLAALIRTVVILTSLVAPVDKLSVAFAMVLAVLFLGEPVTFKLIVGGTLVVTGTMVLIVP